MLDHIADLLLTFVVCALFIRQALDRRRFERFADAYAPIIRELNNTAVRKDEIPHPREVM